MKNFLSIALVAAPLVLLAPDNTAEAVGSLAGLVTPSAVAHPVAVTPVATMAQQAVENVNASSREQPSDPTLAWLMAAGFLGLVMARRVRGQ